MLSFILANARWLLAGLLMCLFSGFGQTYFISLSSDAIRGALNLSHGQFGLAYGAATLASAFALSHFGKLVDVWSVRRSAVTTLIGLSLACALMATASLSVWLLVPAIFGLRFFGQGFCGHVAMTSAGKWYSANRGKAVSIVGLGFPLSESFMPAVAALMISGLGFSYLWAGGAVFIGMIAIPVIFFLLRVEREPNLASTDAVSEDGNHQKANDWRRADVLKAPEFYIVQMATLCTPFMVTAYFFNQQHLGSIMEWDLSVMVASMTVFAVAQVVTSLMSGWIIDKWSSRVMLPVFLLPLAVALCLPVVFKTSIIIPLVYIGLGMTAGASATQAGALWPELFGTRFLGDVRALIYAVMVASTAASPFLTGLLIDLGIPFDQQLACFGAFCLLASGVMLLIQPNLAGLNSRLSTKNN